METTTRLGARRWSLALASIAVGAIAAAPAAELAVAKKNDRRVGTYRGQIELPHPPVPSSPPTGGTVSFRITKNRQVVGFTAADVPVYTVTTVKDPQGSLTITGTYSRRTTFTVPTMSLQGAAFFFYTNRLSSPPPGYQGYEVLGKPGGAGFNSTRLKGYIEYDAEASQSGGNDEDSFKQLWTANKVGGKK
jgi:hypothetical protein